MKLFYRKYGNGPPLIILHGLFGSSDNWLTIARSIAGKFTVILPDQRNHGQSPHSDVHDYDSLSNDIYDLAEELKLESFFLAGHSMGGKAAIAFTYKWPEKLKGLLVADISPISDEPFNSRMAEEHLKLLNAILSVNPSNLKSRADADSILSGKVTDERIRGLILKNLRNNADNSYSWKINAKSLKKNLGKIMEQVIPADPVNFQITGFPVYFLKGEKSEYLPEKDFREIQRIFPAAEFITIEGAGHWINADNPEEVRKCLLRFLD
jgi:esterase